MKKIVIAGASLAFAAMPIASVFAQDLTVTDTIEITVNSACSITENSNTDGMDNKDTTYSATVANGAQADFSGTHSGNHVFHVTCNSAGGWTFSANPTNLTGYKEAAHTTANNDTISFVASGSYTHTGVAGQWTATITAPNGITVVQPSTAGTANVVIDETGNQAANVEITSAYQAYVGTETAAGYYIGQIAYTLAAL